MKITGFKVHRLRIPFRGPTGELRFFYGDHRRWETLEPCLVEVQTDVGVSGFGEAFGYFGTRVTEPALTDLVGQHLIGGDVAGFGPLLQRMRRAIHGRRWPAAFACAAVDTALWDLHGKRLGASLSAIWGGRHRDTLPVYASLFRYNREEEVRRACRESVTRGYRSVKLHETDPDLVDAARDEIGGDVELTLDVNCAWTAAECRRVVPRLLAAKVAFLEEPLWPPESWIAHGGGPDLGMPIAAGENAISTQELISMGRSGRLSVLQPSVGKIGLTQARELSVVAALEGWDVVPHCGYFGPGMLATLQLLAAQPALAPLERLMCDLEVSLYGPRDPVSGSVARVPDGPGLGLDPDPDVLRTYAVR